MICLSLVLVLFISSLMHPTCHAAERAPNVGGFLSNQPPLDWASADQAHVYAQNLAELLHVPADHLQPAYLYDPVTDNVLIMDHFRNRNPRFARIYSHGRTTIFATPWEIERAGTGRRERGALFFLLSPTGHPQPVLHTGFREGFLPGGNVDVAEYLTSRATIKMQELVEEYPQMAHVLA
ncbi:uncharacterized protein UTRI_06193 [Ustilago trichophora]|uniref:DUF985 domain-containing protein n=1 Tax=Ustilago trichophora TaxID=86804 RepID=A0A5C3EF05_9BASI|nr:uncharacterized protein UTRI_06193 [Ustilago trichophora]